MAPLVVIPTYQEVDNVDEVLARVLAADPDVAVLVVDDASGDGTAEAAEAIGAASGRVSVLRRPAKAGLGSAYREGFAWGMERGHDLLVEMDADLSHDPAALPGLLAPVRGGDADLTIGSRYVPGGSIPQWALHRRLLSRWGNRYAGAVLGMGVRDATSGYRVYTAEVLGKVGLGSVHADGYAFQIEMAYRVTRVGGTIVEVPIAFTDRLRGTSKMSSAIVVEALLRVTSWAVRDRVAGRLRRSG